MSTEVAMGSIQGGIQGGTAGFVTGGVPGAIIGGTVGAITGGIVGSKARKAKKYARKAVKVQQERESNAQDAQYLAMVRQARLARAGSLAASASYGIDTSSLATSALSSIGSQSQYSIQYTANDQRLLERYKYYMKKAGQRAKQSQTILAGLQLVSSLVAVGGSLNNAGTAAEQTAESFGSIGPYMPYQQSLIDQSYANALQSGLQQTALMNSVLAPINQGLSTYYQK